MYVGQRSSDYERSPFLVLDIYAILLNRYHVCRAFVCLQFHLYLMHSSDVYATLNDCKMITRSFSTGRMRQRYHTVASAPDLGQGITARVSSCASLFASVFPPCGNLPQKGNDQRDSYWGEKGRVHGVLVLRREIQQRQHSGIEERT